MDENIIQSILEIDKSASEKLAEAEKQRNLIIAGAKEQQEKIIESRIKAADATLKEIEEKEKAEADKKLEAINAEGENILHKTEKEDGDFLYYDTETNEFLVLSTDGYIRTFFKPSAGLDYWERQ